MRKQLSVLSLLVILALALSACGPTGDQNNATPGTGATPGAGEGAGEEITVEPTVTVLPGGDMTTETPEAGTGGTGVAVEENPFFLTSVMNFPVLSTDDTQIGTVNGFVVHPASGSVVGVVVTPSGDLSAGDQGEQGQDDQTATGTPSADQGAGAGDTSGAETGTETPAADDMSGAQTGTGTPAADDQSGAGQDNQAAGGPVLVPWGALDLNSDPEADDDPNTPVGQRAFYLAVDPTALAGAPAFDEAELPGANFMPGLSEYWSGVGVQFADEGEGQGAGLNPVFVDSVDDLRVVGADDAEFGTTSDVILEPNSGAFQYLLVQADNISDMGSCLLPVPWTALSLNTGDAGMDMSGTDQGGAGDQAGQQETATVDPAAGGAAAADETATVEPGGTDTTGDTGDMAGAGLQSPFTYQVNVGIDALANAPCFTSLEEFPDTFATGWDTEISSFWADANQGGTGGEDSGSDSGEATDGGAESTPTP